MSHTTVNGWPVLAGRVVLPRSGVWHVDVDMDQANAPTTGAVVVKVGAKLTLAGTIVRAGAFSARSSLRIIGGKGKLGTVLPAKDHSGAPLSVVVGDILSECGETLSTTSDKAVLSTVATPSWLRAAGPACDALTRVLADAGSDVVWRVLPDGTVWVGRETWPASAAMADVVVLEHRFGDGRIEIVSEAPAVLPGTTFQGQRVSAVEITVEPDRLRCDLLVELPGAGAVDRLKRGILGMVGALIGPRLDHLAIYAADVVQQHDDGRLDVTCDDKRIGSLSYVPIRLGLPGVVVKVKTPSRVLVTFEGGNPKRPVAALWDTSSLDEITITSETKLTINAAQVDLVPTGGLANVRQGDMVAIGGGLPVVNATVTFLGGAGPIAPGAPYPVYLAGPIPPLPIYGITSSGAPNVKS